MIEYGERRKMLPGAFWDGIGGMMKGIPLGEQETIVRWAADEKTATVSTASAVTIRKLDKLARQFPGEYVKTHELTGAHDARYEMPIKLVRFAKPASEAKKQQARERAIARGFGTKQANDRE